MDLRLQHLTHRGTLQHPPAYGVNVNDGKMMEARTINGALGIPRGFFSGISVVADMNNVFQSQS